LEPRLDARIEVVGLEPRFDDRADGARRELAHLRRGVLTLRDEDRGDRKREERVEDLAALGVRARREVADLGLAENLQAMCGEPLHVAGEDEPRAGDVRARDVALHPRPVERLERENVLETLDETTDGELGLHAVTRLRRTAAVRAVLVRATCALSLPNAMVSAGPK